MASRWNSTLRINDSCGLHGGSVDDSDLAYIGADGAIGLAAPGLREDSSELYQTRSAGRRHFNVIICHPFSART